MIGSREMEEALTEPLQQLLKIPITHLQIFVRLAQLPLCITVIICILTTLTLCFNTVIKYAVNTTTMLAGLSVQISGWGDPKTFSTLRSPTFFITADNPTIISQLILFGHPFFWTYNVKLTNILGLEDETINLC